MRKTIFIILLFCSIFTYTEKIELFEYNVSFNADKSLHIVEKIVFNPELDLKHGIIRDIITKSAKFKFFKFEDRTAIKNIRSNFPFEIDSYSNYDSFKLGYEDEYLNGTTEFYIEYDLYNVIRTNEHYTQIYLNAIGQYWNMPIEKIRVVLNFDEKAFKKLEVFTGSYGKNSDNYEINSNVITNKVPFNSYEGLTFKLNLDRKIYDYTNYDKMYNIVNTYPSVIVNLVAFSFILILLIISYAIKQSLRDDNVVIPEFSIDSKISPSLCQRVYINDISYFKSSYEALTLIFLSLITKGAIIKKDKKYILQEDIDINILSPEEKKAYDNLKDAKEDLLKNAEVLYKAHREVDEYISRIYKDNVGSKVIITNILSVIIFVITLVFNVYTVFEINTFIPIVAIFILSQFIVIKKYKENGKEIIRNIKGFMLYFNTAEQNIFRSFLTEKDMLDYSRKMFPYAVALGIQKQFIDKLNTELTVRNYNIQEAYEYIYYDQYINSNIIRKEISRNISKYKQKLYENNHSSDGGFSNSGGYSGGGFSGGGGNSW